jgi:hypothetical protein
VVLLSVVHRRLSGRFADDRLVDVRADRVEKLEGDGVAGPDFDPCVLLRVRLRPLDVDLPALADGRMRIGLRDKEPFADLRSVSAQRGLGALAQGVCRPNRFEGVRAPTSPVHGRDRRPPPIGRRRALLLEIGQRRHAAVRRQMIDDLRQRR